MITVTEEILEGIERRTAYLLAGLEVPEYGAIRSANFEGTTTIEREPLELPSGRELLAHLLQEGRHLKERPVIIAKEAALLEMASPSQGARGTTRQSTAAGSAITARLAGALGIVPTSLPAALPPACNELGGSGMSRLSELKLDYQEG